VYTLAEVQSWFVKSFSSSEETSLFKRPESMNLYREFYWERLWKLFYDLFPFLTRLFGKEACQEYLSTPYYLQYPPQHWSLRRVGDDFPKWFSMTYQQKDKDFLTDVIQLDVLYEQLRFAPSVAFPEAKQNATLYLQPSTALVSYHQDLLSLRAAFLTESIAHWETHPFPKCSGEGPYYYLIFRAQNGKIEYQSVCREEYRLLQAVKKGKSILELIQEIDENKKEQLPLWVYHWAGLAILAGEKYET
jgi:hypothetical protein